MQAVPQLPCPALLCAPSNHPATTFTSSNLTLTPTSPTHLPLVELKELLLLRLGLLGRLAGTQVLLKRVVPQRVRPLEDAAAVHHLEDNQPLNS